MNPINKIAMKCSKAVRKKRAALFRNAFYLDESTKILDLGSETGSNINMVLQGTRIKPENTYIADISKEAIEIGKIQYGYVPVLIEESGRLPFADGFFDIVYCSSVIEHVTIDKDEIWSLRSGNEFKERALERQKKFSDEIQRIGKQYFVQTPYRYFIIESHTWLPFIGWLPRRAMISVIKLANHFWIKHTSPDFNLLNRAEMSKLFTGARIVDERLFMMTKSIMAIKSTRKAEDERCG